MSSAPSPVGPAPVRSWLEQPVESGAAAGFGVYLHVPFCVHRCGYCDFATVAVGQTAPDGGPPPATGEATEREGLMARYVRAMDREIARAALTHGQRPVTSVFVGGGTPTLLEPRQLAAIVTWVRERFEVAPGAEITVEANPETVDEATFTVLARAGVNRVSIGAQSFAPHVLSTLDRLHDPDNVPRAVAAARAAGIAEVSLDLIYGTPGESAADWLATLEASVACEPDHLSAYALTVHANTALGREVAEGRVAEPDPDLQRDRFDVAREVLAPHGFEHYEVSNWSRGISRRSDHNVLYWRHGDYLGLGVGAHGHVEGRRWWNHRSVQRWLDAAESDDAPATTAGEETLSVEERAEERLLLGLRLREGLHPADVPPLEQEAVQQAVDEGLLELSCGRFQASQRGWFLLDGLLRRLL